MATRWRLRPFDRDRVARLAASAKVSPLTAQLLINRGIDTPEAVASFLDTRLSGLHDPELLPGVNEAAERIQSAILQGKKIVIYGDYDVDGVCGTSLLWACLKLAGARNLEYYIPHRVEEGYGVNADALRHLATERKADLVVTVDCGISAVKEARLARELGLEFIVTDHHHIGDELPEADVLVHPRLPGSAYPFGDLCGCAVAFKLAWKVAKTFGDGKKASPHLRSFLLEAVGHVALATVADVMPLHGENRLLVSHGLKSLANAPTPGMNALLEVSGIAKGRPLNAGNIGFGLAPRINAAGRLERAMSAVEMLTTQDPSVAREIAARLDECNTERRNLEQAMVREAREMIEAGGSTTDRGAIVVGKEGWHPGVIGIVAGRIAETYHRPTVVIALRDGLGQGSARSVPGFDLYEAIKGCSESLIAFGGHTAAAGLKIPADRLDEFASRFNEHCKSLLTDELKQKSVWIDAEALLAQLDMKTVESIADLEPHGIGNPKPVIQVSRTRLVGEPRVMGDGAHLKLRVQQDSAMLDCVGWKMADRAKSLQPGMSLDLVGTPGINEFRGKREVQFELKDFRPSEA